MCEGRPVQVFHNCLQWPGELRESREERGHSSARTLTKLRIKQGSLETKGGWEIKISLWDRVLCCRFYFVLVFGFVFSEMVSL